MNAFSRLIDIDVELPPNVKQEATNIFIYIYINICVYMCIYIKVFISKNVIYK